MRERDDDLTLLVGRIDANVIILVKQSEAQGARITELETWKNRMIGMALGAGGIAGGVAAKLASLFAGVAHP